MKESSQFKQNAIIFSLKAILLQLRKGYQNTFINKVTRHPQSNLLLDKSIISESSTELWTNELASELYLEAGKIHNLRIAIRSLNGIEISADSIFSFWVQIGHPTRWKGYVLGRELREGCIIPSIAGGLCQLSNALYNAALDAGLEIIERHAHTQIVPGSLAEAGRDATIFWNYVDLRFKVKERLRIEAFMSGNYLTIQFKGEQVKLVTPASKLSQSTFSVTPINSCTTCDVRTCFRHTEPSRKKLGFGATAYLVDEYWPEFNQYIQSQINPNDVLGLPVNGKKLKKSNYAWDITGSRQVKQSALTTFARAIESRKLEQGAIRQMALLKYDEKLALSFTSLLSSDIVHVIVMQNLLPFLWKEGYLGGRSFDVLMTRLPLDYLQERLDLAGKMHPESSTLSDFRASTSLVETENEALRQARKIITPHTEIADLYREKSVLIDWHIPEAKLNPSKGNKILFPAPTVGRKGAYELRSAALALNLELMLLGDQLEGDDFWEGISVKPANKNWLDEVGLVVLPAFVEHQPRKLLRAIAHGIPAIASSACGLGNVKDVVRIPIGNWESLSNEIQKAIAT